MGLKIERYMRYIHPTLSPLLVFCNQSILCFFMYPPVNESISPPIWVLLSRWFSGFPVWLDMVPRWGGGNSLSWIYRKETTKKHGSQRLIILFRLFLQTSKNLGCIVKLIHMHTLLTLKSSQKKAPIVGWLSYPRDLRVVAKPNT